MTGQCDFIDPIPINILIVDNNPKEPDVFESISGRPDLNVIRAGSGEEVLRYVARNDFALIFINAGLSEIGGFKTAELIRNNADNCHIPIIFLTNVSHERKHVFKGSESGVVDYLFKPVDPMILNSKVNMFIHLFRQKVALRDQNEQLKVANRKILEQQAAVVEEERLKLLLQIAGASAHELNQPLMILLGNIELLNQGMDDPEKLKTRIKAIEDAGRRISGIVKNIQNIRHVRTKVYPGGEKILNIDQSLNILYAEDDDHSFVIIEKMLEKIVSATLKRVTTVKEAKAVLMNSAFDLALLDLILPDGDSLQLLDFIRAQDIEIPVVILTGYGDEKIASSCIHAGANEYLSKGSLTLEEISRGINNALERFNIQKIARQSITKMAELSTRDELTGLYNRRYMNERIEQEVEYADRYGHNLSCLLLDLDHFKQINDIHGHVCGDQVLKEFALRLKKTIRKTDLSFRYGGEEFMVLLPEVNAQAAVAVAEKIRDACQSEKFVFQDREMYITVSIGIAAINECQTRNPRDLIAFADKALYQAKADGRNCIRSYQPGIEKSKVDSERLYGQKGFQYLKEQITAILEKTKRSSLNSLELLIKDVGGEEIETQRRRIAQYIKLVCIKLHLSVSVTKAIMQAASLHGCFSILLGEEIMNQEGPMSKRERELIERHPYMLVELTDLFSFLNDEKTVLNYHHEHYDGSGYPYGIKADEIPLGARIFTLAEAMAAMTSSRSYRDPMQPETIVSELLKNAGRKFDPSLVSLLLDIIAENNLLDIPEDMLVRTKQQVEQIMAESERNE